MCDIVCVSAKKYCIFGGYYPPQNCIIGGYYPAAYHLILFEIELDIFNVDMYELKWPAIKIN